MILVGIFGGLLNPNGLENDVFPNLPNLESGVFASAWKTLEIPLIEYHSLLPSRAIPYVLEPKIAFPKRFSMEEMNHRGLGNGRWNVIPQDIETSR